MGLTGPQITGIDRALERSTALIDTALELFERNTASADLAARFVLAPGLERLTKLTYLLGARHLEQEVSDSALKGEFGHALLRLRNALVRLAEQAPRFDAPALRADLEFVRDDPLLEQLLATLTSYGSGGRYAEFRLITEPDAGEEPDAMWDAVEIDELLRNDLADEDLTDPDRVRALVMARIEPAIHRLLRFIARLWAFEALGEIGRTWSVQLSDYLHHRDKQA